MVSMRSKQLCQWPHKEPALQSPKPKPEKLQLYEIHHAHRFWLRWLGKSKQRRFNNFQDEDTTKSKGKCAYMGKDGRYVIR